VLCGLGLFRGLTCVQVCLLLMQLLRKLYAGYKRQDSTYGIGIHNEYIALKFWGLVMWQIRL